MTQSHSQRVTRSDVAKEAGTSVAVVSYVINNGPRPVAEATRQRVLQAIKKDGISTQWYSASPRFRQYTYLRAHCS